ncbi:hypothetical protein D3875_07645 [Deinococcus cavernae]|uniref:Uncharacterized protein n=2 Tax=Deinococcus cavernae TaxID=2320857 RepID=A0A418V5T2_9DEIO|nr:hypothetical protein [Deinococcus cavernae]RJF69663.1 hypothetical protein D3875_20735 [Deinococcus cavernae]RJF71461.1 hypothetical protein D3875_07645 [Deinococcus cavernae]
MRNLLVILSLGSSLALAQPLAPVTVKPAWTVKDMSLLGFTADGDAVVRPRSGSIQVLDIASGHVKRKAGFPLEADGAWPVAFTPDLQARAWLAGDALVMMSPAGVQRASSPGLRGTWGLKFSPDGKTLAVWNVNGYVQLWNVTTGERLHTLMLTGQPANVTFHPTRPVLAVSQRAGAGGHVTLWNTTEGKKILTFDDLLGSPDPFTFLPGGELLMGGGLFLLDLDPGSGVGAARTPQYLTKYTEPCSPQVVWKNCLRGFRRGSVSADGQSIGMNIARTPQHIPALLIYNKAGMLQKIVDTPGYVATLAPDGRHLLLGGFNGELAGASPP